jgi:dihydroorotate dehydrogenase (NAD+) catalytic subunit
VIRLSNGHNIEYVVASGALGFDGQGWWWERLLVWLGFIKPELFTVVLKTLTLNPRKGNLCWHKPWTWLPWSPWSCVRFVKGGAVNKVGLTNPGLDDWARNVGPYLDYRKYALVGSIYGTREELVTMAVRLNNFNFVALEVNVSCPNTGHPMDEAQEVIASVKAVEEVSRHPVIVKVSVDQKYFEIAQGLKGIAGAVSLNSVPWKRIFSDQPSPLARLEKKLGEKNPNGGGVSGKPAQTHNWAAITSLRLQHALPVIGPSVMEYGDIEEVRIRGAQAVSFGAIHLRTPWRPTQFVLKEMAVPEVVPIR